MEYKLIQKRYNKDKKLKSLMRAIDNIDSPIRNFIIELNKIDGIITRLCCSGHFSYHKDHFNVKINRIDEILGSKYINCILFNKEFIRWNDAHIALDITPEAIDISSFFYENGFYSNRYNNMIFFEANKKRIDWNMLLSKLNKKYK